MAPSKVEVVPFGPSSDEVEAMATAALEDPEVMRRLEGTDTGCCRRRRWTPARGRERCRAHSVQTTVYDYTNERTLVIRVGPGGGRAETVRQPRPS